MARTARQFNLVLSLDGSEGRLSSQLSAALIRAIADGQLADGDQMPSTRALAQAMGVPRSAAVAAYEELSAAGFLASAPGSGTSVGPGAGEASRAGAYSSPVARAQAEPARPVEPGLDLAYNLMPGYPDVSLINHKDWTRCWRAASTGALELSSRLPAAAALTPGQRHDYNEDLRRALSDHVRKNRGILADPEDVFVFPGVNAALRTLTRVICRPSGSLAFEDPGYATGRRAIAQGGAHTRPVPVDEEGLRVDLLTGDDWGVYVTPAHQFPMGSRMSVARRAALLEWAQQQQAVIIEDDYDGEFRYDVAPMPAVRSMTRGPDHVIYLGTASKMIARDLRVAWAIVPRHMREEVRRTLQIEGDTVNPVAASALASFIETGALVRHLAHAHRTYAARRGRFADACRELLPGFRTVGIDAGLHLVLELAPTADDRAVVERLLHEGVACAALSTYFAAPDSATSRGLVCGYSKLAETSARSAVAAMARGLADLPGVTASG